MFQIFATLAADLSDLHPGKFSLTPDDRLLASICWCSDADAVILPLLMQWCTQVQEFQQELNCILSRTIAGGGDWHLGLSPLLVADFPVLVKLLEADYPVFVNLLVADCPVFAKLVKLLVSVSQSGIPDAFFGTHFNVLHLTRCEHHQRLLLIRHTDYCISAMPAATRCIRACYLDTINASLPRDQTPIIELYSVRRTWCTATRCISACNLNTIGASLPRDQTPLAGVHFIVCSLYSIKCE